MGLINRKFFVFFKTVIIWTADAATFVTAPLTGETVQAGMFLFAIPAFRDIDESLIIR